MIFKDLLINIYLIYKTNQLILLCDPQEYSLHGGKPLFAEQQEDE